MVPKRREKEQESSTRYRQTEQAQAAEAEAEDAAAKQSEQRQETEPSGRTAGSHRRSNKSASYVDSWEAVGCRACARWAVPVAQRALGFRSER